MELREHLQATLGAAFLIERELGGGGMSRVFLAEERELGRRVVIKVLPPDVAAAVSEERFRREIHVAARLQHPHIVPLLTTGARDGLLYYTMPYIAGESLRALLARERELPVDRVMRLVRDVVDALAYAHAHGVIHRDIKPDNVLISGDHAVVTDFGVSKAVTTAAEAGALTSAGIALGTPAYMAPEQATAETDIDHRADLYALGAMTYELLTGRPPFVGSSAQQVLAAQITRAPESIRAQRETVSESLECLVMRCLQKRPADRWQSATELLGEIERTTTTHSQTPVVPAGARDTRARRRTATLVAAAVLATAAIAAYQVRRAPAPSPHMIAVIPLIAAATETARDLFPEFLTEEVRTVISERIRPFAGSVRQVNAVSADRFRGPSVDLDSVRVHLNVDRVVSLKFIATASDVAIYAELVNTTDKTSHRWPYHHAVGKADTRALAEQIAAAVLQDLQLAGDAAQSERHQPVPAAQEAYHRGRVVAEGLSTKADLDRAVALFENAVRIDPAYAQPLARMALAYQNASGFDGVPPSIAYPAAEAAARRAVAIDPTNAEAHSALGWAMAVRNPAQWTEARHELDTALLLDPSNAVAHGNLGFYLAASGDLRAALREGQEAIRLDPYTLLNHLQVILWHLALGHPDSALAAYDRKEGYVAGEIPDMGISDALRETGQLDSALARDRATSAASHRPTSQLVISLVRKGKLAEAAAKYDTLIAASRHTFIASEFLARAASALGRRDETLRWLRDARETHSDVILFLRWSPDMRPLLDDPVFREVLDPVGTAASGRTRLDKTKG